MDHWQFGRAYWAFSPNPAKKSKLSLVTSAIPIAIGTLRTLWLKKQKSFPFLRSFSNS